MTVALHEIVYQIQMQHSAVYGILSYKYLGISWKKKRFLLSNSGMKLVKF